jgi:hypothetical protein
MVKGRVKDGVRGEKRNTVTASPRRKQLATAVPGGGSQSDHTVKTAVGSRSQTQLRLDIDPSTVGSQLDEGRSSGSQQDQDPSPIEIGHCS